MNRPNYLLCLREKVCPGVRATPVRGSRLMPRSGSWFPLFYLRVRTPESHKRYRSITVCGRRRAPLFTLMNREKGPTVGHHACRPARDPSLGSYVAGVADFGIGVVWRSRNRIVAAVVATPGCSAGWTREFDSHVATATPGTMEPLGMHLFAVGFGLCSLVAGPTRQRQIGVVEVTDKDEFLTTAGRTRRPRLASVQ